jgi:uncharacterized protein
MPFDPFHAGERTVQTRAGVRALADRVGRSIRGAMPPGARTFLDERRWLVVAGLDTADRPWAAVLSGARGFARVLDERTLAIDAQLAPGHPLEHTLDAGSLVGVLAIDLATRRRLRLNGSVTAQAAGSLVVTADQAFANCPKHIQRRDEAGYDAPPPPGAAIRHATLLDRERAWLRAADTFFIATAVPGEGVDASHRGGMPGFIDVERQRLVWPDYPGNALFNTLGNIESYPRAGLLVPDFDTGAALHLTGRAAIDWTAEHAARIPGAERVVTFDVEEIVELTSVFPVRLQLREYSPFNPRAI